MCNEDESVWITFNGEIYNFQELQAQLVAAGHCFRSHTDTEVIVHGYEEWGNEVVTKLRGMFSFCNMEPAQPQRTAGHGQPSGKSRCFTFA